MKKFIYFNGNHYPLDKIRKVVITKDYTNIYFTDDKKTGYRYINLNDFHIGIKEY